MFENLISLIDKTPFLAGAFATFSPNDSCEQNTRRDIAILLVGGLIILSIFKTFFQNIDVDFFRVCAGLILGYYFHASETKISEAK